MNIWQQRQRPEPGQPIKKSLTTFMKKVVFPRQKKLSAIALAWNDLLPIELANHTCLENIKAGRLTVLVDSAPHLYELNLLVQQGLIDQIRQHTPNLGVNEIILRRGTWYHTSNDGHQIPDF